MSLSTTPRVFCVDASWGFVSEGGKVPWTPPWGFYSEIGRATIYTVGHAERTLHATCFFVGFHYSSHVVLRPGGPCIGKETGLSIGPLDRASTEIGVNGFYRWFVHGFLAGIVCIHTVPSLVRFWRRERFLACRGMSTSQTRRVSCRTTRNGIYAPTALRTLLLNFCASVSSGCTRLVAPSM